MITNKYSFKFRSIVLALVGCIALSNVSAQFTSCYDPVNWSTTQVAGGNGSINSSGAPVSIVLTGPNGTGANSYTHYGIVIGNAGTVTFNWNVAHADPGYDGFGYSVNGFNTQLASGSASGLTSVPVNAGDIFTFYGHTFDGCCGTFNATITNFTPPCCTGSIATTVINPTLCAGDGNMTTLSGVSATGGTITWDNGVIDGVAFLPPNGLTVYTATSSNALDCPVSENVNLFDLPIVTAMVDFSSVCPGVDVTFTGGGADTYVWDNGVTDAAPFTIIGEGLITYTVTGTDLNGCENIATVDVTGIPAPVVEAHADQLSYCDGEMITLTGSGATSYVWDNAVMDGVAFSQAIGTVTYEVTGTDGTTFCVNTDQITVVVYPNPTISLTPSDELFGNDGGIALSITSGVAPFTFDWDNDGVGDNDDNNDLNGVSSGTYNVIMVDGNGCSTTSSAMVSSQLGVDTESIKVSVYPNPTSDLLVIQKSGTFTYFISDLSGRVIANGDGTDKETLSLSEFTDGTYLITISAEHGVSVVELIKQ